MSKADEWIAAFDKLAGSLDGARAAVIFALYNESFTPEDNGRVAAYMVDSLVTLAKAEGREGAAKVCDCHVDHWLSKANIAASGTDPHASTYYTGREHTARELGNAIRSLGAKEEG